MFVCAGTCRNEMGNVGIIQRAITAVRMDYGHTSNKIWTVSPPTHKNVVVCWRVMECQIG